MNIFSRVRDTIVFARGRYARPFSQLLIMQEGAGWVTDYETRELRDLTTAIGIQSSAINPRPDHISQCVHVCSQFVFARPDIHRMSPRMSVDIFHGYTEMNPHFRESLEAARNFPGELLRIRVSNSLTEQWLIDNSLPRNQIFRIPIGVRLEYFQIQNSLNKLSARKKLNIPANAFVMGSFQKDGVGWGNGNEPKLIKGPDILLRTFEILKPQISNLFILLSGPARGYVRRGLERLGIPYRHVYLKKYEDVAQLYQALDAYIVSSRDEGGPKAVLESMAAGIPLITTRVGQATDLVHHGVNGFMVEQEDVAGLAHWTAHVRALQAHERHALATEARRTAEKNSYESQLPLWQNLFRGYIEQ